MNWFGKLVEWFSYSSQDRTLIRELRALGYDETAIRVALERGIKSGGAVYRSMGKDENDPS